MHDIGTAMAGYNPDSRIVGWISVFVAHLGRPLFFGTIPAIRSQKSNAIIQDYGLQADREASPELGWRKVPAEAQQSTYALAT